MSGVKLHFAENALGAALKLGSPRSISSCVNAATKNLETLADPCRQQVLEVIPRLQQALSKWPAEPNYPYMEQLYAEGLRLIGVSTVAGLPEVDQAATSLLDVIDAQVARKLWQRDAIEVHIATIVLLTMPGRAKGDTGPLLEGLRVIRDRFKAG